MPACHSILVFLAYQCLALGMVLHTLPAGPPTPMTEYQGKAKMLRVLPEYLQRPKGATGSEILILGLSPFESALDQELAKSTFKSCYARHLPPPCNPVVVFICSSEEDQLPQILQRLKGKPVLTVGDTPGFTERGVMVGLIMRDDRLTLEVNIKSLREAGLELSPHVLQRARLVGER